MTPWECREPSLAEMMQEPIIQALMARDSVREAELRRLLDRLRAAYVSDSIRRAH